MKMKFTLAMEDLVVNDQMIDSLTLEWGDDVSEKQVLRMAQAWISDQRFLTSRMVGLTKVGESALTIKPAQP